VRRILPGTFVLALTAAACGGTDLGVVSVEPRGLTFITQVADTTDDVGRGLSLATDAEGNPHLAYLSFLPEPEEGQPEPVNDPLGIQNPAVKHAHFVGEAWTQSVVSEHVEPEGDERGEVQPDVAPQDLTAIVVDGDGIHHIAWTAGNAIFYSSNPGGSFSEPEEVVSGGDPAGLSIAEDGGVPWIAFAGSDGVVTVAVRESNGWALEEAGTLAPGDPVGTAIAFSGGQAVVTFTNQEGVQVAVRSAGGWTVETADRNGTGGVDLATDADGNPHLSYYARNEVKHAHSIAGSPWDISVVGETTGPGSVWPTSIALDEAGIHHIAWQDGEKIAYANNEGGEFEEVEVPFAHGGIAPTIGAGAEGVASIAWYDTGNGDVKVSIRTEEVPFLALPGQETAPGGPTGAPPAACEPEGTELEITAPQGAVTAGFDKDCLAAPAEEAFTITFNNQDPGVPHNVTIYPSQQEASDPSAALGGAGGSSNTITGPDTVTYDVDPLEKGTFFLQCDIHPTTMIGTFVSA
jgi:hypothetical protein